MKRIFENNFNSWLTKEKIMYRFNKLLTYYTLTKEQLDILFTFIENECNGEVASSFSSLFIELLFTEQKEFNCELIDKHIKLFEKFNGFYNRASSSKNFLSESFIEKYSDKLNWEYISEFQKLSENFIEKYADKVEWGWISKCQILSESFIEKHSDKLTKLDWSNILIHQTLSESFIEKHSDMLDRVDWLEISRTQKLSENFIEKYSSKLDWVKLSVYQTLSESFIEKHQDDVNWVNISKFQKLSESFIEKFQNKVYWDYITENQNYSTDFVFKFIDLLHFSYVKPELINDKVLKEALSNPYTANIVIQKVEVSEDLLIKYLPNINLDLLVCVQKLSESFILKYFKRLNKTNLARYQVLTDKVLAKCAKYISDSDFWYFVSEFQRLSEKNIHKYIDKLSLLKITKFQTLSENFIRKNIKILNSDSLEKYQYYSDAFADELGLNKSILFHAKDKANINRLKRKLIRTGKYECHKDGFIAYKAIRYNRYSFFNFRYKYLKDNVFESNCDCTNNECSFGLNVGTYDFAKSYLGNDINGVIVKCKVKYEDVGAMVHNNEKVRCFKITVLD